MPELVATETSIPIRERTGIIFRPGSYGEKGDYSDADIRAMAGDSPLPVNLEHRKSLLDGKLGHLVKRFAGYDEAGKTVLMGTWHEPEPLALLLGDTTRKASIEINKATKMPVGLALTHLPHIEDAALFHAVEDAFAQFSRGEEVKPLDKVTFRYESVSERDAIVDEDFGAPAEKLFPARTQSEYESSLSELQFADDPTNVKARLSEIATRKGYKAPTNCWAQTKGISLPVSEQTDSGYCGCFSADSGETNMKVFIQSKPGEFKIATPDEVVAFTGGTIGANVDNINVQEADGSMMRRATPEQVVAFTGGKVKFTAPAIADTDEMKRLREENAQFRADANAAKTKTIAESAEAEYQALFKANRAVPADKETIVAAFTVAAQYDGNRAELAYFSEDTPQAKFSMSEHLKKLHEALPAHNLTSEKTAGFSEGIVLFDQEKTTAIDPATGERTLAEQVLDRTKKAKEATQGS